MNNLNKFQTLIILFMVSLGVILGQVSFIQIYSEYLIMPFLTIMLFLIFLEIPLKDVSNSLKNLKFTLTSLIINFIWTPLLVFILGKIFFNEHPELLIGFVMLMVTPCTDWYLIFTGIAKGNVALGTSILPLNLILQLILLPVYIYLIGGSSITINLISLTQGVILSLFIPLIAAIIFRKLLLNNSSRSKFGIYILEKSSDFHGYFLNIAIVAMFASQGKVILENPQVLLKLLIPILIFFIINFIIGQTLGKFLKISSQDNVALNLTILARNSPIALAIAVSTFPDIPLISLALIVGPLIELPILFIVSNILLIINKEKKL